MTKPAIAKKPKRLRTSRFQLTRREREHNRNIVSLLKSPWMAPASPPSPVADLRRSLERMEFARQAHGAVLPFGWRRSMRLCRTVVCPAAICMKRSKAGAAGQYAGLATLFVASILARIQGPVLWCLRGRDLFAPALARVGLHPDRLIFCET